MTVVSPAPPQTLQPPVVVLPSWTDGSAVATYLTSVITFLSGQLALHSVGIPSGTSPTVKMWISLASIAIAAGVQVVHIVTRRGVQKTAIAAGTPVVSR